MLRHQMCIVFAPLLAAGGVEKSTAYHLVADWMEHVGRGILASASSVATDSSYKWHGGSSAKLGAGHSEVHAHTEPTTIAAELRILVMCQAGRPVVYDLATPSVNCG